MPEIEQKYATNTRICKRLGISMMTLWRWKRLDSLEFPKAARINDRDYNDIAAVDEWLRARAVGKITKAAGGAGQRRK